MPPQEAGSSPLDQELMDEARVIVSIDTKYEYGLCSVTCLNDEEIYTCGEDSIMRRQQSPGRTTEVNPNQVKQLAR